MSAYGDKVRTSLDKHQCISHWVLTAAADERDDIIRNSDDETYAIGSGFYKGWPQQVEWDKNEFVTL